MYENVWDRQSLLFQIKLLKDRVEAFESGEKYIRMEKLHQIAREGDFRTIQRLKKELAEERADRIRIRENSGKTGMLPAWILKRTAMKNCVKRIRNVPKRLQKRTGSSKCFRKSSRKSECGGKRHMKTGGKDN